MAMLTIARANRTRPTAMLCEALGFGRAQAAGFVENVNCSIGKRFVPALVDLHPDFKPQSERFLARILIFASGIQNPAGRLSAAEQLVTA